MRRAEKCAWCMASPSSWSLSWRGLVHGSGAGLLQEHTLVVFLYLTGHVSLCLKQLKFRKTLLQPSRWVTLLFDPFPKPWNCQEKSVSLKRVAVEQLYIGWPCLLQEVLRCLLITVSSCGLALWSPRKHRESQEPLHLSLSQSASCFKAGFVDHSSGALLFALCL